MREFECVSCKAKGDECTWTHHHMESFCPNCGEKGVEIVQWGCFECSEGGRLFFAPRKPTPHCEACGEDAVRILEAPMISKNSVRKAREGADKMLEREYESRGMTDIHFKPAPNPYAAHWGSVSDVLAQGQAARRADGGDAGLMAMRGIPKHLPTTVMAKTERNVPSK